MPLTTATAKYDREQIDRAVRSVEGRFPEIEHIRYTIGEDWANDLALHVRVLLKNSPDTEDPLHDQPRRSRVLALANRIQDALWEELPAGDLYPYLTFRSVAEQEQLRDPQWD